MVVTVARAKGKTVTLSGRISRPLAKPVQEISVTRRISCGNVRVVARFKPDSQGRFHVKLKAPRANHVWTFRFRTKVFYSAADKHLFRTYTLPQYVVGTLGALSCGADAAPHEDRRHYRARVPQP